MSLTFFIKLSLYIHVLYKFGEPLYFARMKPPLLLGSLQAILNTLNRIYLNFMMTCLPGNEKCRRKDNAN